MLRQKGKHAGTDNRNPGFMGSRGNRDVVDNRSLVRRVSYECRQEFRGIGKLLTIILAGAKPGVNGSREPFRSFPEIELVRVRRKLAVVGYPENRSFDMAGHSVSDLYDVAVGG